MFDEYLLYVAPEGVPHIDVMGGHLLVPPGDHEFQAMAGAAGYERIGRDDERYSPALRRAYDELYKIEKGD